MRAVAQRVRSAWVEVEGETVGRIEHGLLVYLAAGKRDGDAEVAWMAEKLCTLRIFEDDAGKLSRAVTEVGGGVLVVSQFTLYGDVRKGRRPSFEAAAPPELAEQLYQGVCGAIAQRGVTLATGRFRAMMQVHAAVDGPITIMIDSEKVF